MSAAPFTLAAITFWIEAAMIVFLAVFLGIVAWVMLGRRGKYRKAARIPLEDHVVTPRSGGGDDDEDDATPASSDTVAARNEDRES